MTKQLLLLFAVALLIYGKETPIPDSLREQFDNGKIDAVLQGVIVAQDHPKSEIADSLSEQEDSADTVVQDEKPAPKTPETFSYQLNRDILSNSAKSQIVDMFKNDMKDSVYSVITLMDSLNDPDPSWLTKKERFMVKALVEGVPFLKDPASYHLYLTMAGDSISAENSYRYRGLGFTNTYGTVSNRVLNSYMAREFSRTYPMWKNEIGSKEDFRDFFEIFYTDHFADFSHLNTTAGYDTRETKDDSLSIMADKFLSTHRESIYRNLVLFNYYRHWKTSKSGVSLGCGGGYYYLSEEPSNWLENTGVFNSYFDIFWRGAALKFDLMLTGDMLTEDTIYAEDGFIIPPKEEISLTIPSISIGYMFQPHRGLMFTPYVGYCSLHPDYSDKDDDDLEVDIKSMPGVKMGLTTDFNIRSFRRKKIDELSWSGAGWRIDGGAMINSMKRHDRDGTIVSVFCNVSVNIFFFEALRVYDNDNWK